MLEVLSYFYRKYYVYREVLIITNISWFSYTGMYTDHTVFNHCVQDIRYFVCFKNEVPYIKIFMFYSDCSIALFC